MAEAFGYSDSLWATYRQWQELGAQVRKGEKSCTVVFWSELQKKAKDGDDDDADTVLFARSYSVFNVAQVDGVDLGMGEGCEEKRSHDAEEFFDKLGVQVRQSNSAFYLPAEDTVYMPPFKSFFEPEGYYSVLSHEVTHWTGHESRLNRDLTGRFKDDSYAMEELVAELGSAFVCAELGISNEPREDHAAYVESWLKVLRGDKRAVFSAAGKAQQAADYMFGRALIH